MVIRFAFLPLLFLLQAEPLPLEPSVEESIRQKQRPQVEVNWISLSEAQERNRRKKDQRPILIDFYTDWCGWCKRMEATTFQHPVLVDYLNKNFYCVRFQAEKEGPVSYRGESYALPQQGPGTSGRSGATHPFALAIGARNGQIGYPTLVILSPEEEVWQVMPGYQTAEALDPVLVYYAEGYFRDLDFAAFRNVYTPVAR